MVRKPLFEPVKARNEYMERKDASDPFPFKWHNQSSALFKGFTLLSPMVLKAALAFNLSAHLWERQRARKQALTAFKQA